MRVPAFLLENGRWLGAGALLTFASSFGQTFFISLFGTEFRAEFDLSDGEFGGIYTIGTVASSLCLIAASSLTDRFRARAIAIAVIALYAAICVAMARVDGPVMLAVAIFGLRFCGQGMMSQIAMTAMARWFRGRRGRAVAIAGLGFSFGEAVFPLLAVATMGLVGWRGTWLAAAAFLILIAPVLLRLLATERTPQQWAEQNDAPGIGGRQWTRAEALRHWLFWPLMIGVLGPPLIGTTLFFQQTRLAEAKGVELAGIAAAYPVYSAITVVMSFAFGWLVDRFGARRLLPFYQIPMALGCLLLASGGSLWSVWGVFALFGLTQGGAVALLGALWPEIYGARHIGAIRGLAVSAMVFATALGPGISGALLDFGVALETQFFGFAMANLAACIGFAAIAGAVAREMRPAELS
jgi:MFS family permease